MNKKIINCFDLHYDRDCDDNCLELLKELCTFLNSIDKQFIITKSYWIEEPFKLEISDKNVAKGIVDYFNFHPSHSRNYLSFLCALTEILCEDAEGD
ncbi:MULTISPECIES: hypothetical protein [unclassified Paenibacillus]|uniref:hypothetical protein n=1 Tax=unclassified Paenibacillus TaxID=185978 RepID=UPI00247348A8|nr:MULTISPECIES: hypothetical protein [unclassified Paenibacillus]MDH6427242.1 hypothetical protein [Paenibacillus sp. PastH-4]MDH6443272.1 hypothetical protein [Paenibacillus sp. PastF-4]MDH6526024.1 hypothetical protein [Paenibacillus sp. PastH-3]